MLLYNTFDCLSKNQSVSDDIGEIIFFSVVNIGNG